MTPDQTLRLCRIVKALCPQQAMDEFTPDAWHLLLAPVRIEDARTAVETLGRRSAFIAPAEIIAEVKRIRAKRLADTPLPDPPADMTPVETLAWLKVTRRSIADGQPVDGGQRGELKPRHLPELRALLPAPDQRPRADPPRPPARIQEPDNAEEATA